MQMGDIICFTDKWKKEALNEGYTQASVDRKFCYIGEYKYDKDLIETTCLSHNIKVVLRKTSVRKVKDENHN